MPREACASHYENTPIQIYEKFHLQKTEFFQIKNFDIFHISAQNIDCGYSLEPPRRGGSNEYPQSMFYAVIRKIMYTPVNPSFTIYKWGLRGSKLYRRVFVMVIVVFPGYRHLCFLVCFPAYQFPSHRNSFLFMWTPY